MSSSENNKVDPLESAEAVEKKIKKAFCDAGNVERNGVLSFCKFVLFPCFLDGKPFVIKRDGQADFQAKTYKELENAFKNEEIHPKELKQATFDILESVLVKVRKDFASEEMQQ